MPTSTDSRDADQGDALAERVRVSGAARRSLFIVGGYSKAWYGRRTVGDILGVWGHRGVVSYEPSELVITARAGTPILEIEADRKSVV